MYKTLQDLERVIAAGKPQKVIDQFSLSYRMGVAMTPYLDIEREYAELVATEDRLNRPEVLGGDGEVVVEGIDYNQLRDDRIAQLVSEHPYLVEPEQTFHEVVGMDIDENGDEVETLSLVADPMPTLQERRGAVQPADVSILNVESADKYRARKRIAKEVGDSEDLLADISKRLTMIERLIVRLAIPLLKGEEISDELKETYLPMCELLVNAVDSGQYVDRADLEEPQELFTKLLGRADQIGSIVQEEMFKE